MGFNPHRVVTQTVHRGIRTATEGFNTVIPELTTTNLGDLPQPEIEGELHLFNPPGSQIATLYAAVDFSGVLDWVTVSVTEVVDDRRTGQPWDPRQKFFTGSVS